VLVELGLGDPDGLGEDLVRQPRVDDLVAVLGQEGRFDAAGNGLPAVEEEDYHGVIIPAADLDSSFLTGTPEKKIERLLVADL
jgi:hypothetical protein